MASSILGTLYYYIMITNYDKSLKSLGSVQVKFGTQPQLYDALENQGSLQETPHVLSAEGRLIPGWTI
jgi:hypothetical protein